MELDPDLMLAHLALAQTFTALNLPNEAAARYEVALGLAADESERRDVLRSLMELAFDARDWSSATAWGQQIIESNPRDVQVRMDLAAAYLRHSRYDDALAQYVYVAEVAGTDTRQRALAVKDIGDTYATMGRSDDAIAQYERAMAMVQPGYWLYRELQQRIIDVYRSEGRLHEYVDILAERWANPSAEQLLTLASLYDESGRDALALQAIETAVARNPSNLDARLTLIRMLERLGDPEAVIEQYETLVRQEPGDSAFQFRLYDLLRRNGRGDEAARLLDRMATRFTNDAGVLLEIADRYHRLERFEDAQAAYERVVRIDGQNPDSYVALGEFHFMEGRRSEAERIWQRILEVIDDPAEAQAALGDVYANHSLAEEAILAYEEACELRPDDTGYLRSLAQLYEDARRMPQALDIWETLLEDAGDGGLRDEARTATVRILNSLGRLQDVVARRAQDFEADASDLETGYFLGEAYDLLGRDEETEQLYDAILSTYPDDMTALLALEELYTRQNRLADAIATLTHIAELSPHRAREYYQRLADLSLRQYDDESAVRFAQLAIELNPDDAAAWARLGSIQRQLQQYEEALAAYRQAVALDERAFPIFFELADLYLGLDRPADADALYRVIVAESTEESQVLRAGRRSIRISQALGTLDELFGLIEPELYADAMHATYLKLLVEVIDAAALPLLQATRRGTAEEQNAAQAALDDYGRRALRPLLDALAGDDVLVKRKALDVLALLGNANATVAMIRVLDDPDDSLHETAALAVARMADQRATEPLLRVVEGNSRWRGALVWALGRTGSSDAAETLTGLALRTSASVQHRSFAAFGLMRLATQPDTEATIRYLLGDVSGEMQAMGALLAAAHGVQAVLPELHTLVAYGSPEAADAAAIAVGMLADSAEERAILGAAYYAGSARLRATASRALLLQGQRGQIVEAIQAIDSEPVLQGWLRNDQDPGAVGRWMVSRVVSSMPVTVNLNQLLEETFVPALHAALQGHPERQSVALVDLVDRRGRPSLARLAATLTSDDQRLLTASMSPVLAANRGPLIVLAQSPQVSVAAAAIRALAGLEPMDPEVLQIVVTAVAHPSADVQVAALQALPPGSAAQSSDAILHALTQDAWDVRSAAAEAVGRVGIRSQEALQTLRVLAEGDASRHVRHVATRALFVLSPESIWPTLQQAWPSLDRALRVLLAESSPSDPQIRAELAALALSDIDVMVREVAGHLLP
jgi:tetratricopeptide (TPR) repeat protein